LKIGIIVDSKSGFTYSIAQRLEEKLSVLRHDVQVERIEPIDEKQVDIKKIQLKSFPEINQYEAIIFGAWVRGGFLSPAMAAYMNQMPSLQGKKIACFVTKGLPFAWTGGNQTINRMVKLCESKEGRVVDTGMIIRMGPRKKQTADLIAKFGKLF
jgi:NAD(P)H dehydrogenase (quinone)